MLSMEGKKNPAEQNHPGHSSPTGETSEAVFKCKEQVEVQENRRVGDGTCCLRSQVEKQVRTAPRFSGAAG